MKQNIILTVLISIFLSLSSTAYVLADGDYTMESIGSLTYEVPASWTSSSLSRDNQTDIDYFNNSTEPCLTVAYAQELDQFFSMDTEYLSSAFSTSIRDIYSESDLTGLSHTNTTFEGYPAILYTYSIVLHDQDYKGITYMLFMEDGAYMIENIDLISNFYDNSGLVFNIIESLEIISDGYTKYPADTYIAGEDIPPGEYILYAENMDAGFRLYADTSQEISDMTMYFDYNSIVTIENGNLLKLSDCYAVPIEENPIIDTSSTGMFKVGLHIPAGEYQLEATGDGGRYAIFPDSTYTDIISNEEFDTQTSLSVSDGQYLDLNNCKFAEPPTAP